MKRTAIWPSNAAGISPNVKYNGLTHTMVMMVEPSYQNRLVYFFFEMKENAIGALNVYLNISEHNENAYEYVVCVSAHLRLSHP